MDSGRWDRIQRVFHDALELPEERREAFVKQACANRPEIEADVLALLHEDRSGDSMLERGVADVAGGILEGPTEVPDRIGPYRITRKLGEGGMGVVYLARREDLNSLVAIKFLRDAKLSPHRRERFRHEQRILARLSHPSISRLLDASTLEDGTPYIVMEYVDGLPLTEFCKQHGSSLRRRLQLFRQVCEAVQYAHRQALIHRDLKPSNILATGGAGSGEPAIKLLDFGIAKRLEPDDDASRPTGTVFGIMTPAYASPEQLRGQPIGVATDVYSLGVVLYELLTGCLPFDLADRTPYEAARTVTSEEPLRPSARKPAGAAGKRAWDDLDVLCMHAMHKDPERRYPTVEALLRDVDHYLDGEPLTARPDSVGYRAGKFVRRNRRSVTATIAVILGAVAMITFYTIRLSSARNAALAEAARTQRVQHFMLDLFRGGDEIVGPEQGLEVTELIDRGVKQARAFDGEPEIQAELYQTLGEVYSRMSEFESAERMLTAALQLRRELHGNDHPDVGESLMALGLSYLGSGQYEEAERHAREALEIIQQQLPPRHPRHTEALSALGHILERRGNHAQAIDYLERALALQQEHGDTPGSMVSMGRLADTHFYAGNYEESDEINRELLILVEEQLGANHPAYATRLINLAATRKWLGYLDEAEQLYRDALVINEAYHGRDHVTVASNLSLLGNVLYDQKRYDEALPIIEEALAAEEKALGPDHPDVAITVNKRGLVQLALGDLEAAEASFARELAIYRATVGDDHPWIASGLSNLATIQFRRGHAEQAEETMRLSLATFEAALKPEHVDVAIARIKLGRLLAAGERYEEALEPLRTGHDVLAAQQASPQLVWIKLAREELAAIYEALGDETRAGEFRQDLR